MTALILQHGEWGPPGVLADWAAARGIGLEIHHAQSGAPLPALNGQAFVASLGSPHNPADLHIPEVAAELAYVEQAIARDIPVLGLCFGGQMLAKALGGEIEKAPHPELGWHAIESAALPEIQMVERARANADDGAAGHGRRIRRVLESEDVRSAVLVKTDGLHSVLEF